MSVDGGKIVTAADGEDRRSVIHSSLVTDAHLIVADANIVHAFEDRELLFAQRFLPTGLDENNM